VSKAALKSSETSRVACPESADVYPEYNNNSKYNNVGWKAETNKDAVAMTIPPVVNEQQSFAYCWV